MVVRPTNERQTAIQLLGSGMTPAEVAEELGRSLPWVYKWRTRFETAQWPGLDEQSHAPHHSPTQLPARLRQAIRRARLGLEAEATQPGRLCYVGAYAVQARLRRWRLHPLPSISSIERELRAAGLTHPHRKDAAVVYPHLQPTQPHQLMQLDIYPRYLAGGTLIACFNAIDVVSHCATGQQAATKRAADAQAFLLYAWGVLGVPTYTQLDNEGCFSGGTTHRYVLGRVLRLGLFVGTQLVYSPFYHPQSNGTIERFHHDYAANTWDKLEFRDLRAVQRYSPRFFRAYVQSTHQMALAGQSPHDVHQAQPLRPLPTDLQLPAALPLTEGQVHFMRQVRPGCTVRILNVEWPVPQAEPRQGVWATLEFGQAGATLRLYDQAPDVAARRCLVAHPFPLHESVRPRLPIFR